MTKNKGGRPIEFNYKNIDLYDVSSEKKIEKIFSSNIHLMMKSIFDEEVMDSTRQYSKIVGIIKIPKGNQYLPKRGRRADLFVKCKSGNNYLIEIKKIDGGKNSGETFKAIGQLLFYSIYFSEATKLVLVSNKYEELWLEVIKKYNLPIEFVLIGKNATFLLKK